MPLPIPLHGQRGLIKHAGTGFLVDDGRRMWLVTCAHIITGLKKSPPTLGQFQGARLELVGTNFGITLFEGEVQRFSAVTNEMDGFLADVIAVRLECTEMAALIAYGSYSLGSIVAPHLREPVTAVGFPGMTESLIASTKLEGYVDQIQGLSVELSVPSAPGFSGSALESEAGLIGIVHGDIGHAPEYSKGLAISFDVVGTALFS